MKRTHAIVIALALGIAAMLGTFAATRSAHLGAATRKAEQRQVALRARRITQAEQALRRALVQAPALPPATPQRTLKTVYVRPAPIVLRVHRGGGERESEGGGERDD